MEGGGPGPGGQQAHWAHMSRGNARHVPPDPPIPECPSLLTPLFLLPPPSLLCPWDSHGLRGPQKAGNQTWKPNKPPSAELVGEMPLALPLIPRPKIPRHIHPSSSSPILPPTYASRTPTAGGCPGGKKTRPKSPAGLLGPKWVGEMPVTHLLILWSQRAPPMCLSFSPPASLPPSP